MVSGVVFALILVATLIGVPLIWLVLLNIICPQKDSAFEPHRKPERSRKATFAPGPTGTLAE